MGIFDRFLNENKEEAENENNDKLSCNINGHNWQVDGINGYYTSGVPHLMSKDSFTVKKKIHKKCSKCGKSNFVKEKIGEIKVNKETDELTVKQ